MELNKELDFSQKVEIIKDKINQMISIQKNSLDSPSWIWEHFTKQSTYVKELSTEHLKLIRIHCKWLTGIDIMQFISPIERGFHTTHLERPTNKFNDITELYRYCTQDIPEKLHISEPQLPSETGLKFSQFIQGEKIITHDVTRYQPVISNMYRMKVIDTLPKHPLILEIGTGYGGFAYHLSKSLVKLGKSPSYILLDLPQNLFLACIFLTLNQPNKRFYIYDKETFTQEFLSKKIHDYDYILLPNFILKDLEALTSIDLMINLISMQEMLPEQVEEYSKFAKRKLNGLFVSNNSDSFHINLDTYSKFKKTKRELPLIFSKYFELFPSPQFYKRHIYTWKFYPILSLYFLLPKGKEYPAGEFSMKLRTSMHQIGGIDLSIFFIKKADSVKIRVKKTFKISLVNLVHLIKIILLYLDTTFLSSLMRKVIPRIILYFLGLHTRTEDTYDNIIKKKDKTWNSTKN